MSDQINQLIHTNARMAFEQGAKTEHNRLIKGVQSYFELTCEPDERGKVIDNPEWDAGYQAALAILKGMQR